MPRLRPDSLFARLLLVQAALALALATVFAVFFYVERNVTVARLLADRWAPPLRQALGLPNPGVPPAPLALDEHRSQPPGVVVPALTQGPRLTALRDALARQGVQVLGLALARGDQGNEVWLQLPAAQGPTWYRLPGDELVALLPLRMGTGLLLGMAAVLGVCWAFTRWLTRPLRQIDAALHALQPGDAQAAPPPPLDPGAPAELRAIDQAWRALHARWQAHEQERALLLAGVSHDLRAPLSRIRMAADFLPDAQATRRDSIVRNVQVADRLIEDFLDHVRAGHAALDERADLAAIARRVAAGFELPSATLAVDAPEALICEAVHTQLLERLMANLVENALRHGQPPVVLRVARLPGQGERARVEVAVDDHGPGIDPARWDELRRAFARGDASRGTPGSGLGLAIVERIAQRLGGRVELARTSAGATPCFTVRVILPR